MGRGEFTAVFEIRKTRKDNFPVGTFDTVISGNIRKEKAAKTESEFETAISGGRSIGLPVMADNNRPLCKTSNRSPDIPT